MYFPKLHINLSDDISALMMTSSLNTQFLRFSKHAFFIKTKLEKIEFSYNFHTIFKQFCFFYFLYVVETKLLLSGRYQNNIKPGQCDRIKIGNILLYNRNNYATR